jgi:acyl-CoA dehydrogenase
MFLVPCESAGLEVVRTWDFPAKPRERVHTGWCITTTSASRRRTGSVRKAGFAVAQTRLGGGSMHHAMRSLGICQGAFDMMCERALSRTTKGFLADKQYGQGCIADSSIELEQFRLLVTRAKR